MTGIRVASDGPQLAQLAASTVIEELRHAIQLNGSAVWVLAGGTTPNAAYKILASDHAASIDWRSVWVLIGDERCVPLDSPESNWYAASALLLDHLDIPHRQLLRPKSDAPAETAASEYASALGVLPGSPRLDVIWLGMGEDGHTLSLFPGRREAMESDALVVPVHNAPKPPPDRISLTLKALRGAATAFIMAAGAGKAAAVAEATSGDSDLPIARAAAEIERAGGRVHWLLDKAAAGRLGHVS